MNTNKRLRKGTLTTIILSFTLFGTLSAQHMGQGHNMDQSTMQHMNQQMMDMQQMMHNIDNMMERTSGMMDAMHEVNQMGDHGSMGTMGGNSGDMDGNMGGSGGMMNMVHSIDKMTNDMQGFMNQMDAMMQNGEIMNDPLMSEYMENMQEHMGTVMNGFESVITEMEKIQILNSK